MSNNNNISSTNDLAATPEMCYHCFDVLVEDLTRAKQRKHSTTLSTTSSLSSSPPLFAQSLPDVSVECPLFVTWEKKRRMNSDNFQLRGCIGTLSPRLLVTAIGEYAIISATKDRRFAPIQVNELTMLRVGVSLLVQYEECDNVHDWIVGKHGILIKFIVGGRNYNATYLPEVAKDQQWNQQQAVLSLIQKAGYQGSVDANLLQRIHCTRYQSSKCRVTFGDYVQHNCQGNDPSLSIQRQQRQQEQWNNSTCTNM